MAKQAEAKAGTEIIMGDGQALLQFPGFEQGQLDVLPDSGLRDPSELVGVPFVVTGWREVESDYHAGETYVIVDVRLQDGSDVTFMNGATWEGCIRDILRKHYAAAKRKSGLVAPRGLRQGENKKGDRPIYSFA